MLPEHDYAPAPETPAAIHAAYLVHLRRRQRGNTAYTQAARSFLRRWPQVQAWAEIPLEEQLAANCSTRPFVTFLMVSRRLRPGYDYLVCRKLCSLWHELTDSCRNLISIGSSAPRWNWDSPNGSPRRSGRKSSPGY